MQPSPCARAYAGSHGISTCVVAPSIATRGMTGGVAQVQAGAGIVSDSNPTAEYEETRDKARALIQALEMAEEGM